MAKTQAQPQPQTQTKPATKMKQSSLYVGTFSASGPRPYNEDNIDVRRTSKRLIALVADGMGGGEVGASVSDQAIKFAAESLQEQRDDGDVGGQIRNAFSLAHQSARNFRLMGDRYAKSGSTLVCTVLEATSQGMQAHVGNIGDSRVYLVRNKQVTQLSTDHNVYEQLIAQGATPQEARVNPNARKLTYCLGTSNDISMAPNLYTRHPLQSGDALLLCSDGVGEFVSHTDIATILGSNPPELAAQKIVEKALQNKGNDNASAVVINYGRRRGALITFPTLIAIAIALVLIGGLGTWLANAQGDDAPVGMMDGNTVTPVPTEFQVQASSTARAIATSTLAPPPTWSPTPSMTPVPTVFVFPTLFPGTQPTKAPVVRPATNRPNPNTNPQPQPTNPPQQQPQPQPTNPPQQQPDPQPQPTNPPQQPQPTNPPQQPDPDPPPPPRATQPPVAPTTPPVAPTTPPVVPTTPPVVPTTPPVVPTPPGPPDQCPPRCS